MPTSFLDTNSRRLRVALDRILPDRPVRRTVKGVDMLLPRRHLLPYFVDSPGSPYAQNLIDLARYIVEEEGELSFLDVGANVGDSTMFVLDQVPGSAVCVEADPAWARYLEANLGDRPGVALEPSALLAPGARSAVAIRHADAGSSLVERSDEPTLPTVTTDELLERYPQLSRVRLIKSDTDGYDVMLVPAMLGTFTASRPVVFFEFDPRPTALCTPELDADALWYQLLGLGYEQAVVWNNFGDLLGRWPVAELLARSEVLRLSKEERGYGFWDVAVAHRDDPVGLGVLDRVAEQPGGQSA